jgi:hypothetical protein
MFEGAKFNGDLRPWGWSAYRMMGAFGDSFEEYKAQRQRIEEREALVKTSKVEIKDFKRKAL